MSAETVFWISLIVQVYWSASISMSVGKRCFHKREYQWTPQFGVVLIGPHPSTRAKQINAVVWIALLIACVWSMAFAFKVGSVEIRKDRHAFALEIGGAK